MNGDTDTDTTPASHWVTHVTALLTDYLATTDSTEAKNALDRIATPSNHDDRATLLDRRRTLRAELLAAGVHLPPDV